LFLSEVGVYEIVQVPVQDRVHVARLRIGAVVLGHAVGMQNVGADLAPETYVHALPPQPLDLLLPLPARALEEPGLEDAHGRLAVGYLRAFVLAVNHDAGGQVGDA